MGQAKNRGTREERINQVKEAALPQWQPISMLPMLADLLAQQLVDVQEVLKSLQAARDHPHVMDDNTVGRVIKSYTEQHDFILSNYPEQISRWRVEAKAPSERQAVDQFESLNNQVVRQMGAAIDLAQQLSHGTIDKIIGMSDEALGEAVLTGRMPFPGGRANRPDLGISERRGIAKVLDGQMQALMAAGHTGMDLLVEMYDVMPGFKRLLDTAGRDEMNRLMAEFPALHKLAKMLEEMASKIQSGELKVPR